MARKGKHNDDNADDDSGNKGSGRHRDTPPNCPVCVEGKVRVNMDNMVEILTCEVCKGTGLA